VAAADGRSPPAQPVAISHPGGLFVAEL